MEAKNMKPKVKKGFWKPEEDLVLKKYVETHGEGNWATLSKKSGKGFSSSSSPTTGGITASLMRSAKSCRLRWKNYLRPNIKRGMMSEDEKDLIIRMHKLLGNRWSLIAGRLPGRTDNEIKNYWNTHLNKKFHPGKEKQTNPTTEKKNSLSIHQENVEITSSAEDAENRGPDFSVFDPRNITYDVESSLPASDGGFSMPIFDDLVLFEAFDAEGLPILSNV